MKVVKVYRYPFVPVSICRPQYPTSTDTHAHYDVYLKPRKLEDKIVLCELEKEDKELIKEIEKAEHRNYYNAQQFETFDAVISDELYMKLKSRI